MKSAESILLSIQNDQREHDRLAHRDILNLDTQTLLKHMTLHFLKYAGKIAIAREEKNDIALASTLVDALIICLATANALNVSVGQNINESASDLDSLSQLLGKDITPETIFNKTLTDIVIISGRMAKAIESTDHLERGDPRAAMETLIVDLTIAILANYGSLALPLEVSIRSRWHAVEAKSIFSRIGIL